MLAAQFIIQNVTLHEHDIPLHGVESYEVAAADFYGEESIVSVLSK